MKTIRLVFFLVFVCGMFGSFDSIAQAKKTVESDITVVITKVSTKETFYLKNGDGVTIETESGNFLKKISFKLADDHYLMQFSGPNLFIAFNIIDNGVLVVRDELAVLTRSGNLKITYHINGAGNRLPVGWIKK